GAVPGGGVRSAHDRGGRGRASPGRDQAGALGDLRRGGGRDARALARLPVRDQHAHRAHRRGVAGRDQAAVGGEQGRVGPGEPVPGRAGGGVTALVTGASSGIGAAFARQLAAEGQELVVVARDADRLEGTAASLRSAFGVGVEVLPADLAVEADTTAVRTRLSDVDWPADRLVNSAAIGLPGRFWETPLADQERMFHLNCTALLRLSHAALGAMVPRGRGDIIVVSSVSGFAPTVRGSYGASKAWATAFAESLSGQLAGTGVHVSAVA